MVNKAGCIHLLVEADHTLAGSTAPNLEDRRSCHANPDPGRAAQVTCLLSLEAPCRWCLRGGAPTRNVAFELGRRELLKFLSASSEGHLLDAIVARPAEDLRVL
jgi:hypothetical protein